MLETKTLDSLFELFGDQPGWLARMAHISGWTEHDQQYMEWRDRQQWVLKEKLRAWQKEIDDSCGWDIYNEVDLGRKLALVNQRINSLERQAETFVGQNRHYFLQLSDLDKLVGLRYKLRNRIMAQIIPDRVEVI